MEKKQKTACAYIMDVVIHLAYVGYAFTFPCYMENVGIVFFFYLSGVF